MTEKKEGLGMRFTEAELVEMDKNIREGFYDSRLANPYLQRALIDMARVSLDTPHKEKLAALIRGHMEAMRPLLKEWSEL